MEKKCTKCHQIKDTTEFYKNAVGKNGLRACCKKCDNQQKADRHRNDSEYRLKNNDYQRSRRKNRLKTNTSYRSQVNKYVQKRRQEIKIQIMKHYGPNCHCCDENRIEFLTIDHIDGKGAEHRRQTGCREGTHFYRWLIKNKFPQGFRVLCMNCNKSLGQYGYCPHNMNFK